MNTPEIKQKGTPGSARAARTAVRGPLIMPVALALIGIGVILLLPTLGAHLFGPGVNVYWYLSRSSALVAYFLLWASLALGVSITNKLARLWPGAPTAFDLHQYLSLLGLGFVVVHVLMLLGDDYIGYNLVQLFIPFASTQYQQFWIGVGQIGFYLLIPVTLSFYARKRLGTRGWRTLHGLSYAFFGLALLHSVFSGTDTGTAWTSVLYAFTAVSLLGLTVYRVLVARNAAPRRAAAPAEARGSVQAISGQRSAVGTRPATRDTRHATN